MKIVRLATVVGFLILTANIALADGAGDPRFQTIGGGHSIVLNSTDDPNFVLKYDSRIYVARIPADQGVADPIH